MVIPVGIGLKSRASACLRRSARLSPACARREVAASFVIHPRTAIGGGNFWLRGRKPGSDEVCLRKACPRHPAAFIVWTTYNFGLPGQPAAPCRWSAHI